MFTQAEQVAIRKYCGYGVMTAIAFNSQGGMGKLNILMGGLTPEEESEVRDNYLVNLRTLESAIMLASDNLDTDQAAVWTHNKNEAADRQALYNSQRMLLCSFLDMEPGPGLSGGGSRVVRC